MRECARIRLSARVCPGEHANELSRQEFREAVQQLGLQGTSGADIDAVFNTFDEDGGGYASAHASRVHGASRVHRACIARAWCITRASRVHHACTTRASRVHGASRVHHALDTRRYMDASEAKEMIKR